MSPENAVGITRISKVEADRITVRGSDLCTELIGKLSYTGYFLFLITGEKPSDTLVQLVDASMVAIAEHGFVPSVQVARMTYASAPDALQGAVAAGLLGCGPVILGASSEAGQILVQIVDQAESTGMSYEDAAIEILSAMKNDRRPVPGFGHPVHRSEDPRATRLLAFAKELGAAGRHTQALQAVEAVFEKAYGRFFAMNVSAAIPAVLLDAGFPQEAMRGVPLVARAGALVAHLTEEKHEKLGFKLAARAELGVTYDGTSPNKSST